jgi:hypothetical protein
MSSFIFEKWIWITIGCCIAVLILPYSVLLMISMLPDALKAVAVFTIIILWGIAAGYKDWLMDVKKRKEKEIHE